MFELVNTEYSTAACPIWSVATWLRATILKYGAQHCLIVHNQSHHDQERLPSICGRHPTPFENLAVAHDGDEFNS